MATGFSVIFLTPLADVLTIPDGWTPDYISDAFAEKIKFVDNEPEFTLFDHEPTQAEIDSACFLVHPQGENAELRQIGQNWRLRVRYPVVYATETRGGIGHIYTLSDPKLPPSWGNAAVFWWVHSSVNKLKQLHDYINGTLGFGPVAGALAACKPDSTVFFDKAVQNATGLTNVQQLNRVRAIRDALQGMEYSASALTVLVEAPTGKTEDDLIRALVSDLGFTMDQLFKTMFKGD